MADYAHNETDKELAQLEARISQVYAQAAAEMKDTVKEYFDELDARAEKQMERVEKGEITAAEYKQWELNQFGRGERYESMANALAERYTDANEVAIAYVNDATPSVYSLNRNYAAYTIEEAGASVSFNLWDESTVKKLIVDEPDVMPYYPEEKAVSRGIDLAYGKQQIRASITSGILQGKSVYKIADDMQKRIQTMNRASAVRSARTAFTEAENAGRQDCFEAAAQMGIHVEKTWLAAHDDRVRLFHAEADGQSVPYNEPFHVGGETLMFPGDPSGSPENIYNCRCTVKPSIASIDKVNTEGSDTFEEWLKKKEDQGQTEVVKTPIGKNGQSVIDSLKANKIDYKEVKELETPLTSDQIVARVGGGDMTAGSCSSLAFTYLANENGLDVLDFRGGDSRQYFARYYNIQQVAHVEGVSCQTDLSYNEIKSATDMLKNIENDKDYYLACGKHAAVVRKTEENGLQYMELQTRNDNGWHDLNSKVLHDRFGARRSHTIHGVKYQSQTVLIDGSSLKNNDAVKEIMGYINTDENKQRKGVSGYAK